MDVCFITPIKNLPSRWEADAECLKEGAMGPGLRYKEPERGREVSPTTYPNELIRIHKD